MRSYLRRLAVTVSAVSLLGGLGAVALASAASASGGNLPAPALKAAEQGSGTIRLGTFDGQSISGDIGTFREQCVASNDGRHFDLPAQTQFRVSVTRSDNVECKTRPTQSTWFLSVTSPEQFRGVVTFSLSQNSLGGAYDIRCEEATGRVRCADDRNNAIRVDPS